MDKPDCQADQKSQKKFSNCYHELGFDDLIDTTPLAEVSPILTTIINQKYATQIFPQKYEKRL